MKDIDKDYRKHMGKILKDKEGDFIIFRPNIAYRTNANTTLININENNQIIFDAPPNFALPLKKVQHSFQSYGIDPGDIKYIFISHAHQDHFSNLSSYQRYFNNAKTMLHENDVSFIKIPMILPPSWENGLRINGYSQFSLKLYKIVYGLGSHFYFRSPQLFNKIDIEFRKDSRLKVGDSGEYIKILHTPGHSPGHSCLIDARKNLYVGDLVPFTPWCEPVDGGIENMLTSIEKIISLPSSQVNRIVKSHGDIRRKPHTAWETAVFDNEKEKYRSFLEEIHHTLEKIPQKIKGKNVQLSHICDIFNPNWQKYSKMMKRLFLPPAMSWAISYCIFLEKNGMVTRVQKKNKFYWTA